MKLADYPQCDAETIDADLNAIPDTVRLNGRTVPNRFKRTTPPPSSEVVKSIAIKVERGIAIVTLVREMGTCIFDGPQSEGCMAFATHTTVHALKPEELAACRTEIERHEAKGARVTQSVSYEPAIRFFDVTGYAPYC